MALNATREVWGGVTVFDGLLRGYLGKQIWYNPIYPRQARRGNPKQGAVDRQSVPPTQKGARGYDAGKKVKERTRHTVVDARGSVLDILVTLADVPDAQGTYEVLDGVLSRLGSV